MRGVCGNPFRRRELMHSKLFLGLAGAALLAVIARQRLFLWKKEATVLWREPTVKLQ